MKTVLASIYARTGREQEAVGLWDSARRASPDLLGPRLFLIEHHASAGRMDEAAAIVAEVRSASSQLTAERAGEFVQRFGSDASEAAALVGHLRQLGLP